MVVAIVFGKCPPTKEERQELAICPVAVFITRSSWFGKHHLLADWYR
jgi:hypothetical protein